MASAITSASGEHHEVVDVTPARRPRVLMVVANPGVSTTTGWPVGFWAAELFLPPADHTTIASPEALIATFGRGSSDECPRSAGAPQRA